MLLTGETPNLGPKRYFPALRVCGGTTIPTNSGSKLSEEACNSPEVLAAEKDVEVEAVEVLLEEVLDVEASLIESLVP